MGMGFSMNVSDAEEIKKEVVEEVKPSSEEVNKLKKLSNSNVEAIMNINMDSLYERKEILKSIDEFGLDTIQRSSQKNELLEVSIKNLSKMGDEGGEVAVGLTELQRTMKDLDPSMIDFTKKGLFGRVSNPIRAYFDKYQKADTVINDIMESLERGKTTLKNDNTMWVYYMLKLMDLYRYHTGAAQPGLAVKKLNTIDVIVADINLQNQFAAFVHQINKSKFEVQKSLEKTQLLYDSLMQEYFG